MATPEQITERLHKRMKNGMLAEVKKLHAKGVSYKRLISLGLEYKYLSLYLQKKFPSFPSKEEMLIKLETEIRRFSKRQMTWWKKDKRIKWFKPNDEMRIKNEIENWLQK